MKMIYDHFYIVTIASELTCFYLIVDYQAWNNNANLQSQLQ